MIEELAKLIGRLTDLVDELMQSRTQQNQINRKFKEILDHRAAMHDLQRRRIARLEAKVRELETRQNF